MAKPKLFIHIGLGKTGTTSLQNYFWENRKVLARHGVTYPEYGIMSSAHHLLSPHTPPFLKTIWKFIDPKDWVPQLARQAGPNTLISSELISSLDAASVAAFAQSVMPYFDARIIVYVRRIDNLVMADYNQQIKAGPQKLRLEDVGFNIFERLRFDKKLQPWLSAFGAANVDVRAYERQQFHNNDICQDFLHRTFGTKDFSDFQTIKSNPNTRLSFAALEYKRIINNIITDTNESMKFNAALLDYSARSDTGSTAIFHESNLLPPTVRTLMLRQQAEAFEWIARELMHRPDGRLFYEKEPDTARPWVPPVYTEDEFRDITSVIMSSSLGGLLLAQIDEAYKKPAFERYFYAMKLMPFLPPDRLPSTAPKISSPPSKAEADPESEMKFDENDRNKFEVGGERFVIDTTAGPNRRKSDASAFTIVKTRRFLDIYAEASKAKQGGKLLELGIFEGGSLVLFDQLFKPSKIVGIDLKKNSVPALDDYVAKRSNRMKTYYGMSQDDAAAVTRVVDSDFGGQVDIVVDDASHLYEQTKASFKILFPKLAAGGVYIIEDWCWSFQPPYQNPKQDWYGRTAMATLLIELMADMAISPAIESIQIFKELAIIKKGANKAGQVAFGDAHFRGRGIPNL